MKVSSTVTLLFCGDLAPMGRFEQLIIEDNINLFADIHSDLTSADFRFANLECPLTESNAPLQKSGPNIKANPKCIEKIKKAGFDVVGLANNHILDYGEKGLQDTLHACAEAGIQTVGAGLNLSEAEQIYFFERQNIKVALIALAEHEFSIADEHSPGAAPLDPVANYFQIQHAKSQADVVIVTIHGGNEYFPYPRPQLRKVCQYFIDLGCSAVICHHPHVPGAYEYYQDKPIIYSLGNFIFDNVNNTPDWDQGYMAKLQFDVITKKFMGLTLVPYQQSVELRGIQTLSASAREKFLNKIERLRQVLQNQTHWLQAWQTHCDQQARNYIARQYFPFHFRGLGFLARHTPLMRLFFWSQARLAKLNMLRCESHRELLIEVLKRWQAKK